MKPYLFIIPLLGILFSFSACGDAPREVVYGDLEVFTLYFEEGNAVEYDYYQEGVTTFLMDCDSEEKPRGLIGEGTISIEGTGPETASFIMKDISITDFEVEDGEQLLGDKMNQPGTNEATGLKPDGTFDNNPSSEMLFDMLFNLPPADIALGESIEKEVSFPVNAYGSATAVVATKTITYQKDTVINGDPCAVLYFELHDSGLEKSLSFKPDSYGKYEGHGVTYFNLNKHEIEGAINSILIDVFIHLDGEDSDCFGTTMDQTSELWRKE